LRWPLSILYSCKVQQLFTGPGSLGSLLGENLHEHLVLLRWREAFTRLTARLGPWGTHLLQPPKDDQLSLSWLGISNHSWLKDSDAQGHESQSGDGGQQPAGRAGLRDGQLCGEGKACGGGEQEHRVADRAAGAAATPDGEQGGDGDEFADDGVGPAEPLTRARGGVGQGPVFDVGEGCGAGEGGDGEQDEDQDGALEPLGAVSFDSGRSRGTVR
jgi:hypothetical protein